MTRPAQTPENGRALVVNSLKLRVDIRPDTIHEGWRSFTIALSGASGGKASVAEDIGRGTIRDDH